MAWHPLPADPWVPSGAVVSGVGLVVGEGRAERTEGMEQRVCDGWW